MILKKSCYLSSFIAEDVTPLTYVYNALITKHFVGNGNLTLGGIHVC
jgi:hypothetical protein